MVYNFTYEWLTRTSFSLTKCLRAYMSKNERMIFHLRARLTRAYGDLRDAYQKTRSVFPKKVTEITPSANHLRFTYGHLRGCCVFATWA